MTQKSVSRSTSKYLIVFVILISLLSDSSSSQRTTESENEEKDCKYFGSMLTLIQKHVTQVSTCAREGKFLTPFQRTANHLCIVKCALKKLGMLDEDGTLDVVGVLDFVNESIPPSFRNQSENLIVACQGPAEKIDNKDETCQSYMPLIRCVLDSIKSTLRTAIPEILRNRLHGNGRRISPLKMIRCAAMGAHVEHELAKLDLESVHNHIQNTVHRLIPENLAF